MNKGNVLYLELKNDEILKCDTCKRIIKNAIMFLYIDELSNFIKKIRCEVCYNQAEGK